MYSRKIWVPSLFALLAVAGLGLALTHLHGSVSQYGFYIGGRPAPWYPGAILAVLSFTAMLTSLWWYWLPDWEQPRASLRTEREFGGRIVPVLMFPYSTSLYVFLVIMSIFIAGLGMIGGRPIFLLMVALPILGLLMRVVFGRQFVGLTADGLVWRVMPAGPSRGGTELQGRDIFTRQPVQFLPWSAIKSAALADVAPTVPNGKRTARSTRASLMLRISVSDPAALAILTHYQRMVSTETGMDILIPMDRHGLPERMAMFGEGLTRAEPETIQQAVKYYLLHPEERGQIGTELGKVQVQSQSPEAAPHLGTIPVQTIRETQNLRGAAQHVGARTAKAGQAMGGAVLGVPYFVIFLVLLSTNHLPSHGNLFFPVTLGYLLLIVLPGSAALSCAMAAFAAPDGQERIYARASLQNYFVSILTLGVMALTLGVWQYFDPKNLRRTIMSIPWTVGALILTLICLIPSGFMGLRVGLTAKTSGSAWLARFLARW